MIRFDSGFAGLRGMVLVVMTGICCQICGAFPVCSAQQSNDESSAAVATPKATRARTARKPPGLIYIVGTVERVTANAAIVDLGNVHALKPGSVVTVFRSRDGQFSPLGILKVANSLATWMQTEPAEGFLPEVGDLILFIRTIGEIGTGTAHQDRFLSLQYIKNQNRNGYTTLRSLAVAESLLDIRLQQPRWFQYEKRIAGVVRGETLRDGLSRRTELLLEQINLFRRLHEEGFSVAAAAGTRWEQVMQQLQGPAPEPEVLLTNKPPKTETSDADDSNAIPIIEVQLMVSRIFFDRTLEEQAIASAMCTAMLQGASRNEPEWLRRELQHCQLPQLAEDIQFRSDAISVVRQLREKQQQS